MNNYMKRLVSKKKTTAETGTKNETKPMSPRETVKPKSYRRRINRLVPPPEKPAEVAPPTKSRAEATTKTPKNDETSNKPSSFRIRRSIRSTSATSLSDAIGSHPTPSSGAIENSKSNDDSTTQVASVSHAKDIESETSRAIENSNSDSNGVSPIKEASVPVTKDIENGEFPTKEASVPVTNDIESENENNHNHSESENKNKNYQNNKDGADGLVEETADTMEMEPESPKRPLVPWDEQRAANDSDPIVPSPTKTIILENENIQRELAKVQLDRDIYQQQVLEAQTELETARTSLRDQITDLEDQLNTLQQSEPSKTEAGGNVLSEEEKKKESVSKSVDECKSDIQTYKERVAELEKALEERKSREHALENGVRQIETQAQVESEKLEESQGQVQSLRQNSNTVTTQEHQSSSKSIASPESTDEDPANSSTIPETSFDKKRDKDNNSTIAERNNSIRDKAPKDEEEKNVNESEGEKSAASPSVQSTANTPGIEEKSAKFFQRRVSGDAAKKLNNKAKNNDEVVHNLHLRLDEEIAKLKLRKERRRERASKSEASPLIRKYRSFLDPSLSARFLQPENEQIAPVLIPKTEPEETSTTDSLGPKTSGSEESALAPLEPVIDYEGKLKKLQQDLVDSRAEKERLESDLEAAKSENLKLKILVRKETLPGRSFRVDESSNLTREKEASETQYKDKMKEADEAQRKLGDENIRLTRTLESVNESKSHLEVQLENAAKQAKDSQDQLEKLTAEATWYQSILEKHEREKTHLKGLLESTRKEMVLLENQRSTRDVSPEEIVTKSEEEVDALDENKALRSKLHTLEDMLSKLEEEKEHLTASSNDQINILEQRILNLQTESKSDMERLSNERDGVLEGRDNVESKFQVANEQLDESRERESALKATIQEMAIELESVQAELQKLSKTKEQENANYLLQVDENNRHIARLKEDVSIKEKRLDQASKYLSELESELLGNEPSKTDDEKDKCIADLKQALASRDLRLEQAIEQLMELEQELFDRDDEIDKLNAKRMHIEDKASKLLIEMEIVLQKEEEEIDRLEVDKSKLRKAVNKYEEQIEKQVGRLAEASMQLSELESELFAKDDDIEEIELKLNAIQAVENERLEALEELRNEKISLQEQLEFAHDRIQNLVTQISEIKEENERKKMETRRLLMEDQRKNKELSSSKSQVNRQLRNVSKLTEQNDVWQLQLEKASDEKRELAENLAESTRQVNALREKLEAADEKLKELNATNTGLKDDLDCAIEEDEKNRRRISQMEEQKEALSLELESAIDNLADLKKHYKESKEREENLSSDIFDKLQANIQSARAADQETAIQIKNLTNQIESDRQSLKMTELRQNEVETEEQSPRNRTRLLIEFEFEERDTNAVNE